MVVEGFRGFPLGFAVALLGTAVVHLAPFRQRNLAFGAPIAEIDFQRNDGQALLLAVGGQAVEFPAVQQ